MELNEFYSVGQTEFGWFKDRLEHNAFLSGEFDPRVAPVTVEAFVEYMAEFAVHLGLESQATLPQTKGAMLHQLGNQEVTRPDLFFNTVQRWLETKGAINLRDLMVHARSVGMVYLSISIEMLQDDFYIPLYAHELQYTPEGQLLFRIIPSELPSQAGGNDDEPVLEIDKDSAMYKALHNEIIIRRICDFLDYESMGTFRETSALFAQETLRKWRNRSTFNVYSYEGGPTRYCCCIANFNLASLNFASLFEKTRDDVDAFATHPVKSIKVSYRTARTPGTNHMTEFTPLFTNPRELEYFALFGSNIVNLSICCGSVGFWIDPVTEKQELKLEWLLLKGCPNLQSFEITGIVRDWTSPLKPIIMDEKKKEANNDDVLQTDDPRVNTNLRTLKLSLWRHPDIIPTLIALAPNLKELHADSPNDLEALVDPANNGTRIKLQHLELHTEGTGLYLNRYIDDFPETLTVLSFRNLELENVRSAPFDEYRCIGKSVQLTHLTLNFHVPGNVLNRWYFDLSQFRFHNLLSFDITFVRLPFRIGVANMVRFDFNTLRQWPKVESVSIRYEGWMPGARFVAGMEDDYFFNGDRNFYIPHDIEPSFPDVNVPFVCNSVLRFTFTCWISTVGDIANFFSWFPRLTSLHIRGNVHSLEGLANFSLRLRKVLFETGTRISLSRFRPLIEANPDLTLCIKINNDNGALYKICLENGRLRFKIAGTKDWTLEN